MRVVVVGAGLAGIETAKALRDHGHAAQIVLLGDEVEAPYDRPPLSKHVLRGERAPFPLLPDGHDLDVRLGVRGTGLDAEHRFVQTDAGDVPYDALVLATGASPRRLPGSPGRVLRTLADSLALRRELLSGRRLAVVGAALIGCEVAASARTLGCEVALIDVAAAPIMRVLGPAVGARIAALHRAHGVVLHLGMGVAATLPKELLLDDGARVAFDVLLEAIGVVPCTQWLVGSGVPLDDGIVCGPDGRTALPGVWAVGDVARWDGVRTEHWTSAVEQAAVVAADIVGRPVPVDSVPYWWSEQYDLRLQGLGRMHPDDDVTVVTTGVKQREVAVYAREGRVTGVVGFSAAAVIMRLRPAVAEGAALVDVLAALG